MRLPFPLAGRREEVKASTSLGITDKGLSAAERMISGGVEFEILTSLSEHSPRTAGEVSVDTNLDIEKVKYIAGILNKKGWISLND